MLSSFAESYTYHHLYLDSYYTNKDTISGVFVISLEKDIDRYAETVDELDKLDISHTKFPAVYGTHLKQTHPQIHSKFTNLTDGEIGCFLSHWCLYHLASTHSNPNGYTIIMEDDIMGAELDPVLIKTKILNATRYDTNLIYLGKCLELCDNIVLIDNDMFYGHSPLCFHAYIIKNSFAKKIVDYINGKNALDTPIDKLIPQLAKPQNDIIIFHPSLFYQNPKYDSNLRGKMAQQFNTMDCRVNTNYWVFWIGFLVIGIFIFWYIKNYLV
jgi:GR25 family glycosyltransferase involved in LPS biosynthesis